MKQGLEAGLSQKVNRLIRESLAYAFARYPQLPDYVRDHAQEMEEQVMRQHIDLYVNDYSLSLGEEGKKAVSVLFETWARLHGTQLSLTALQ